jgi:hypothetical protein
MWMRCDWRRLALSLSTILCFQPESTQVETQLLQHLLLWTSVKYKLGVGWKSTATHQSSTGGFVFGVFTVAVEISLQSHRYRRA